ncbi:MAG: response regulator [Armatimonadota bacterium]|nr:response regulator [Armatimonadota bacterium]
MDPNSQSKLNVLIVTSDPSVLKTATQALAEREYTVITVPNGSDALDVLKQRAVDIMLSDIDLPGMPGVTVAKTASRMFPDLSVVLMTDGSGTEAARSAVGCGASDYVSKPLDTPHLLLVLERNLERRKVDAGQLYRERSQVLFSAIKALAAAIDAKSFYTATHSSRVTTLCLAAGSVLGLSSADMATLELAAQIHDIGNIGTPDEVLDKPGTLTDVEWVDILRHPDVGSSILSHVPGLTQVSSIVRHHHERYDGGGYPDGLSGDAIPLLSRVVAVADAYEAMTSERPYRHAKSHVDAIKELRANARTQFDPIILECFIAAVDDIEAGNKAA